MEGGQRREQRGSRRRDEGKGWQGRTKAEDEHGDNDQEDIRIDEVRRLGEEAIYVTWPLPWQ